MTTLANLSSALLNHLMAHPEDALKPVKVWLPGSTINLQKRPFTAPSHEGVILIEGNLEPGSALDGED